MLFWLLLVFRVQKALYHTFELCIEVVIHVPYRVGILVYNQNCFVKIIVNLLKLMNVNFFIIYEVYQVWDVTTC